MASLRSGPLLIFLLVLMTYLICVDSQQSLKEGDSCTMPNQEQGICKKVKNCAEAKTGGSKTLPLCSITKRGGRTICCKRTDTAQTIGQQEVVTKSKEKCLEYSRHVTNATCGRPTDILIIRGIKCIKREFPHMVALGYGDDPNISWSCGGSLISHQYVLTVGHCLGSREHGLVKWALLGDLNYLDLYDAPNGLVRGVDKLIPHPAYNAFLKYNDIALIKLAGGPVPFSPDVRPACLETRDIPPGVTGVVTGWGMTEHEKVSPDLMKASLRVDSLENCNKAFQFMAKTKKLPRGIEYDSMICAGDRTSKDGLTMDSCGGDSGGPFQTIMQTPFCMHSIAGLVSFGLSCGSYQTPGVYTRVSHYVEWIESVVWPK